MREAEHIMILDFSGVPMSPAERVAVFVASVMYQQELYHGVFKFDHEEAEGTIKAEGHCIWAGTSGEIFAIEFDEKRRVKFLLPSAYEEMPMPQGFVTLKRLRRTGVPTFAKAKPTKGLKLH